MGRFNPVLICIPSGETKIRETKISLRRFITSSLFAPLHHLFPLITCNPPHNEAFNTRPHWNMGSRHDSCNVPTFRGSWCTGSQYPSPLKARSVAERKTCSRRRHFFDTHRHEWVSCHAHVPNTPEHYFTAGLWRSDGRHGSVLSPASITKTHHIHQKTCVGVES